MSLMNYKIEFVDKISDAEEAKMTKDMVAYERAHGIDVNYKKFSIVLRDDKEIVFGVLNAFTAFAEIYVDDIWVDTPYRGKGYGKKLLQELENHFQGRGFNNINLVTNAFQAPGFYEKCGFKVEFVRENKKHPKLTKTFFVKFFNEETQTQGILKKKNSNAKENKGRYPLIIGISGISGSGKYNIIKKLSESLQATTIFWDDYDEISKSPQDYVEWFYSGKDYNDWIYPDLVDTLQKLKKSEAIICPVTKQKLIPTKYILFDAPLGYCHQATGKYIDFLICLDTAPDIALARRLIRDYQKHLDPQKVIQELKEYLFKFHPLFILSLEDKTSDLIINGNLSLDEQEKKVLNALSLFENKEYNIELMHAIYCATNLQFIHLKKALEKKWPITMYV
ncbi:MAG: GNAT family N-acetyltransferase [Parachlamydiaceae bacterium]|nr:GNAT family N-acetyltransferase [Parachlamydiaceae bacterium]